MAGQLPQFLGIGVQKGGTTTLQCMLEAHPGVFVPPAKELHFFTLHYAQGESWYSQQFVSADSHQRCGEVTPYYVFHPEAPRRIAALLPDVKLIALLRDPVERALSQYFHSVRHGFESLPLDQALAAEAGRLVEAEVLLREQSGRHRSHQEHSYLARSRYEQQLPEWQRLFGSEQLLVLRSEDLFTSPERVWTQVLEFLALEPCALPTLERPANAGRGEAAGVPAGLRAHLREQLQPTYLWVAGQYGITWP